MKKHLFILIAILSATLTQGQITITLDDVQSQFVFGKTFSENIDTAVTNVDIGSPGNEANYWDFSNLNLIKHISYNQEIIDPSGTPFSSTFPDASWAIYVEESVEEATGEIWWYGGFPDNNIVSYGYGSISESQLGNITAMLVSSPGEVNGIFPMTLGTSWNYTGDEEYTLQTGFLPITSSATVDVTYEIDAFGTMKLPDGTEVNALRLKESRKRTIQIASGLTEDYEEIIYTFFGKNGEELSVSLFDNNQPDNGIVKIDGIIWTSDMSNPNSVKIDNTLPQNFQLKQNYPNPFNPSTVIEYSISNPVNVSLIVYDILGNEIATLVNEFQGYGTYRETFNANNLPSGNYFVHLKAGNYSSVKKMMLIK